MIKSNTFDKILYANGPITIKDFVNEKLNNIHKQLFLDALYKYLSAMAKEYEDAGDIENMANYDPAYYLSVHKLIEKPTDEYWQPSQVLTIDLLNKKNRKVIDLTPYWNMYNKPGQKKWSDIIIDKDDPLVDAKINYIDFCRGEATLYSKMYDKSFKVGFDYLDSSTPVDTDNMTLKNTFSYKMNNKIYGE